MRPPVKFHSPVKIRAIFHCDTAGMDFALKIGTVGNFNLSLGLDITEHLTTDTDILGVDLTFNADGGADGKIFRCARLVGQKFEKERKAVVFRRQKDPVSTYKNSAPSAKRCFFQN